MTDPTLRTIQARHLVVGVSQDTDLWGYRDPTTGHFQGFDIDVLRSIALRIFGGPASNIDSHILYVVVPNGDRLEAVQKHQVDILAETMTISCIRKKSIDFSSVYFDAGQRVLVPVGSPIRSPYDLGGRRVCAAASATSLDNLAHLPVRPPVIRWTARFQTDCLVMLQQGEVDAISTDDTILEGMAKQDPTLHLVGKAFSDEPYGIAIAKDRPALTRFVNAVLQLDRRTVWPHLYATWVLPYAGGSIPSMPVPTYSTNG